MDDKTLIFRLGGIRALADLCEVTPQAVSQWRKNGIPKARLQFLRLAKPEVFAAEDRDESPSGGREAGERDRTEEKQAA